MFRGIWSSARALYMQYSSTRTPRLHIGRAIAWENKSQKIFRFQSAFNVVCSTSIGICHGGERTKSSTISSGLSDNISFYNKKNNWVQTFFTNFEIERLSYFTYSNTPFPVFVETFRYGNKNSTINRSILWKQKSIHKLRNGLLGDWIRVPCPTLRAWSKPCSTLHHQSAENRPISSDSESELAL